MREVLSVMFHGVSLTVVPILSLGADQKQQIQKKAVQMYGQIIAIHIDEVRYKTQSQNIIEGVVKLTEDRPRLYCYSLQCRH